MQPPGEMPVQLPPDMARFHDLKQRHGSLAETVTIQIPDLGRSASVTCTPKGRDEIEVTYRGVSERGQPLSDRLVVRRYQPSREPHGITAADGSAWSLGHLPGFHVADDAECLVGVSEDMRIREAIIRSVENYLDTHPTATLVAELLRQARRHAGQEAAIRTIELRLAADRRGLVATAMRITELETALEASLDVSPTPSP